MGNKVACMHLFSMWCHIYYKKDTLIQLNTKHEFAQINRLNIVINVEEAF